MEFSSSVAATLQELDVSGCTNLISIDAVCSCVKLRCLSMLGCVCQRARSVAAQGMQPVTGGAVDGSQ
jgi:hypothetical protein